MEHENPPEQPTPQQPPLFGDFGSGSYIADMLALLLVSIVLSSFKTDKATGSDPTKHRMEHIFLTKSDLAKALNVSVATLTSRILSAKKRNIKIATAYYGARPHYSLHDVVELCKSYQKDKT